jgi:hypothetical protein
MNTSVEINGHPEIITPTEEDTFRITEIYEPILSFATLSMDYDPVWLHLDNGSGRNQLRSSSTTKS